MLPPPEQDIMTLSLKLFKATPAQLPAGLLQELTAWMTKTPTYGEVAMRPGCVHTSTTILATAIEEESIGEDMRSAVQRVYGRSWLRDAGDVADTALLQLHSSKGMKGAVVLDGGVKMLLDLKGRGHGSVAVPTPVAVKPLAVTAAYRDTFDVFSETATEPQHDRVFCRSHSTNAQIEVLGRGELAGGLDGGYVRVGVPDLVQGSYVFEFSRGPLVSSPIAFLVLNNEAAVNEVRQLETNTLGVADVPAFVQKLGLVARMNACVAASWAWDQHFPCDVISRLGDVTIEVASVCLLRGWPALLECALSVLDVIVPANQAVKSMEGILRGGLSVLEAAVVTGDARLVDVLCTWAEKHDIKLMSGDSDPESGLNAFHYAAMLRDPCSVAMSLLAWVPRATQEWSKISKGVEVSPLSVAVGLLQEDLLRTLAVNGVPMANEMLAGLVKSQHDQYDSEFITCLAAPSSGSIINNDSDEPSSSTPHEISPRSVLEKPFFATTADVNQQLDGLRRNLYSPLHSSPEPPLISQPNRVCLILYHLMVAVLLPALLPEHLGIGAALAPAVITAASCGHGLNALELAFAMVQATIMAVLAVGLNKSPLMAYARAGAMAAMCDNPALRAALGVAWMAVIACQLPLSFAQQCTLLVTNMAAFLMPTPTNGTCKAAWWRMIGIAGCCLTLAVVVPLMICKVLWWAGYPVKQGSISGAKLGKRTCSK